MALQSDGKGLTDDSAVAHLNAPAPQRVQYEEGFGLAGLASRPTFDVPPNQGASVKSGTIDAFVKTCQRWHLSPEQQIILLGYSGSGFFGQQLLEGRFLAPSQDVRERAGYVLAISLGLSALFDNSERTELAWLNTPRDVLSGKSPLAFMLEGRMVNLMDVAAMVARERGM
jgi:hypothetical protein